MTPEITPADREAAQKFDIALDVRLTGTQLHNLAGAFARHRIAAEQRAQEAEPVAFMYERVDGTKDLTLDCNGDYARILIELGATETPLYTHPPQADGDLTAAYLAGSASRNDEVRALQAEVVRLREALREVRGGVLRNILTRIDAILAGEG